MKAFGYLLLIAIALLAGCGSQEEAKVTAPTNRPASDGSAAGADERPERESLDEPGEELVVSLDGYESPADVGLMVADSEGYFAKAGVAVSVYVAAPINPIQYATGGEAQVVVSHQPQVVMANEKGTPIVAIASLVSESTSAFIWLEDSGIKRIADLRGKTIAIQGLPFQREFLAAILEENGLSLHDVSIETAAHDLMPPLVNGRADAIFGGAWNEEGIALEARGMDPVVTRVEDLGIPNYDEFVLVARRDFVSHHPRTIRSFLSAVARGTAAAIKSPELAVDALEYGDEGDPEGTPRANALEVEATLPLLSRDGHMDPEQARKLADWMKKHGMIETKVQPQAFLTNAYR